MAVLLCPPKVAVRVAEEFALMVPAVAVNVPLVDPALMVMVAGAGSKVELLDRPIVAEAVTALLNVTVQTVACPFPNVFGVQVRLDSCAEAVSVKEAVCDTPLALAVTTAV